MNILLTSAGRRSYLVKYFKNAIGSRGEVHVANSEWSTALEMGDQAAITPLIYEGNYIQFVLDYCIEKNIKVVISLFDIDLPVLSKAKSLFLENGIQVIVSDYNTVQICNDKWSTYQFLKSNGFLVPRSFLSVGDCLQALNNNELEFPLIIKPRWGMGSISIYKVDNEEELRVLYKKTQYEILNSYLKYESSVDKDNMIIIQEFIKGQEYGLDVINDLNKNHIVTLVKRKTEMRSGETDGAISEKNEVLEKVGQDVAEKLGHIANLDVDCFMVNNNPYILEMNCRFGGGYPFSHLAGVNLPLAIIKWVNKEDGNNELKSFRYGVEGRKNIEILEMGKIDC